MHGSVSVASQSSFSGMEVTSQQRRLSWLVEPCDVTRHRSEIVSLFEREGKARFADRFEWYYRSEGQEAPLSWTLLNEHGEISGLSSVTKRTLMYGGKIVKAGISGNLIVDRGRGLYLGAFSLVRAMMSLVENGELDILLGCPNRLSQPVFQRMGFRSIDTWESKAMIYRSRPWLRVRFGGVGTLVSPIIDLAAAGRRVFSRHSLTSCRGFQLMKMNERDLDELRLATWEVPTRQFVLSPTADYLFWRFLRDPVTPCDLLAVLKPSGEPCAYLACRHLGNRIVVADCAVDTDRISYCTAIACLCRELEAQNSGIWVTTLRSSPLSSELSSYGFVTIPSRRSSSFSPLVGYWLPKHPLSEVFARPASWNLFPGFNDVLS